MSIKMSIELPDEVGQYYWTLNKSVKPITVNVCRDVIGSLSVRQLYGKRFDIVGGYWAKVELDQFEFED